MVLSIIPSVGNNFDFTIYPTTQTKITYNVEPTHTAYNQFVSRSMDGSFWAEEKCPFTVISNELVLLAVQRSVGESFKDYMRNTLFFNEISFSLLIQRDSSEDSLDDMNLGLGFVKSPRVDGCTLNATSDDGMFQFKEPGIYHIRLPYLFTKVG